MHFRQSRGAALRALPAIAAAAPFAVFALRILIHHRDPDLSGDSALLDMATRSAAHFHREVGPYSRYGFSHPGPALFYAAAPVLVATSDAPWALMLAVQVISGLAAVGAVLVVQQRRGVGAGAVTAGVVLIYAVAVDLGLLQMAWNPLVIMLPVVLCLVAAAAAVDRPAGALAVTFLAGTFAVQTHVGTTPVVAGAAAVAIAGAAFGWRRFERGRALIGPAVIAGVGVLAWVPPLLEQITHNPGNLGSLLRFFRSGTTEATPGFEHQVAFAGRQLAVVPFGLVYKGSLSPATVSLGRGVAAFVVFLAAAAVLIVFGWRRGHSLSLQLGIVSAAGAVTAAYAVSGIRGEVYWYLTQWISAVGVPLLLGWLLLWRWTPR